MSLHAKVSGAWKTASAAYIKISGAWKQCKQVYVKVNGTWKPCLATAQTATGPAIGNTVTLSNVQVGSTITITGSKSTTFYIGTNEYGATNVPFNGLAQATYTVTGATLVSSSGNGNVSGGYYDNISHEHNDGYRRYEYGSPPPSLTIGPQSGDYTITLTATASTVKIKLSSYHPEMITVSNQKISYTS